MIITQVRNFAKQSVRRFTRPRAMTATIELALFAPYNRDVAAIGSWNGWMPTPMTRDEHGWWRAALPLADGDYEYKFRMKSNSYFVRGQ
ncbi:MAG TPA: glycogen-binding domain-containing protein, partial [Ktedonobacterales bacterium]|nr:glycogen-binding domain-containing protein [Ktedonobacterales bacterium]